MKKENKLGAMPVTKLVCNVSIPLMVSMLVQSLYNLVDGIFVSRLNEDALTATSLAYPVQMLMIAVTVGTGVGINTLIAQALGKKQPKTANRIAGNGFLAAICWSLFFMAAGLCFARPFLSLFTANKQILGYAVSYLQICMSLSGGFFLATTGERTLQATGKTFLSMLAQLSGAVCNLILDPIFIFGLLGVPKLGIRGAAIATVIGQWLAAAAALLFNQIKNTEIRPTRKDFLPDRKILGSIYRIGIPTILTQTMGSIMVFSMNKILYPFSSTAVAFFGVYYKLQNFLYMPINGLAMGLLPIVGYNYGAQKYARVQQAFYTVLRLAAGVMAAGTTVFMLFPRQLLILFSAGTAMQKIGVPALRIIAPVFVLTGVTVSIGYYFSGLGNAIVNMIATALRQVVLLVPLIYAFSRWFGLGSAWYAMWISEAAAAGFSVWFYQHRPLSGKRTGI
ncbi:MAG: MATE family efflux transporter [Oscillospiraceae bacterium]|jgi:putative MATE family efflux protein|nr:MATE family efflux transporter [Oscillospiraceae bacterium]